MEIQTRSFQGGKRLSYLCLLGIFVYTALPHGVRDGFRNPNSGLLVTVRAGELRGSASTHNESAPPEVPPEKKEGEQTSSGLKGDSLLADQEPSNTDNKDTFQDDTVSRRQGDEASEQPTTREADEAGAEPTDEAPVTEDSGYYSQEPSEPDEIYERRGQPEQEDEYEQWVTAFDVPEQLRRRIEGDDPMYYNLVLEERLYLMDSQAVPPADQDGADGEGARRQVEDPSSLLVAKKNGVYAVCYARTEDDVWERCAHAAEAAEGIYIQMHEMTDFGRMVDPEEGVDPSTVKAELTADHYTRSLRDLGKSWFGNIKDMKEMTGLKVAGIWFGPPDFERMDALLKKYPDVFDGIYVDWEDGVGACPDKLVNPPRTTSAGEPTAWANNLDFFFRYYMGGQDSKSCLLEDQSPYSFDTYVRVDREMKVPEEWVPAFPCFGGHQGRCYRAFRKNIAAACDPTQQRFMFAPYERTSDKLLTMFKEGCRGLGYDAPPQYDIIQYV